MLWHDYDSGLFCCESVGGTTKPAQHWLLTWHSANCVEVRAAQLLPHINRTRLYDILHDWKARHGQFVSQCSMKRGKMWQLPQNGRAMSRIRTWSCGTSKYWSSTKHLGHDYPWMWRVMRTDGHIWCRNSKKHCAHTWTCWFGGRSCPQSVAIFLRARAFSSDHSSGLQIEYLLTGRMAMWVGIVFFTSYGEGEFLGQTWQNRVEFHYARTCQNWSVIADVVVGDVARAAVSKSGRWCRGCGGLLWMFCE